MENWLSPENSLPTRRYCPAFAGPVSGTGGSSQPYPGDFRNGQTESDFESVPPSTGYDHVQPGCGSAPRPRRRHLGQGRSHSRIRFRPRLRRSLRYHHHLLAAQITRRNAQPARNHGDRWPPSQPRSVGLRDLLRPRHPRPELCTRLWPHGRRNGARHGHRRRPRHRQCAPRLRRRRGGLSLPQQPHSLYTLRPTRRLYRLWRTGTSAEAAAGPLPLPDSGLRSLVARKLH